MLDYDLLSWLIESQYLCEIIPAKEWYSICVVYIPYACGNCNFIVFHQTIGSVFLDLILNFYLRSQRLTFHTFIQLFLLLQCSLCHVCQPGQKVCRESVYVCVIVCASVCLSLICRMDGCVDDNIPLKKGWDRDGDRSREDGRWLTALPWGLVRGWRAIEERHSVWSRQSLASARAHVTRGPSNTQTHASHYVSHHPSFQITLCVPPVTQLRQKLRDVQGDTRLFIISEDSSQRPRQTRTQIA